MKCPRCKTNDVYLSESGNRKTFALLTVTARCHRCCHLFQVPRWVNVPRKSDSTASIDLPQPRRRAA